MKKIKIGIIGLGYWGPNLLRNFLQTPNVKVIGCADANPQRLKIFRQTYPTLMITSDYHKLLESDTDGVVIATPPTTHFQIAKDALKSRKHVLIEKPMTTKHADALILVKLAKKVNRQIMVDHIFVYAQPVIKLKELISKKRLGNLFYYDSTRVNFGIFQSDTNVLWDLACHDFSILEYLFSAKPKTITCVGAAHTKNKYEDLAYITMQYADGFIAHITVNWLAPAKIRRIIIGGSKRMVIYDEGDVEERIKIYDKDVRFRSTYLTNQARINYRIGEVVAPFIPATEALKLVCKHFTECINHNQTPKTDGQSGANIVRYLELAEKSLKLNKSVSLGEM